jgi:uncharacterized protein (DUF1800 family)
MAAPGDPRLTIIGLQRFGLGVRPGDLASIKGDVRELFLDEVARRVVQPVANPPFETSAVTNLALFDFQEKERAERERKVEVLKLATDKPGNNKPATSMGMAGDMPGSLEMPGMASSGLRGSVDAPPPLPNAAPAPQRQPARNEEPGNPGRIYREEMKARFHTALLPLGGFGERLVQFWSNHFCVSALKGGPVRALAGVYEREVIRPHVFGRFADMLLASATNPAMIVYLDNQQSIGPGSRAGQRRGRGLNENLAREIMELHTLGVAGGYTQGDVTSLARIITGWSVAPRDGRQGTPGNFLYNDNLHEPGSAELLGKTYAQAGQEQGKAALADLARHPSTAQHIARKLARHFVADDPPPALVARLAKVFTTTDGDLQAVSRALLEAPESWQPVQAKMRSPQEFLIAAARAFDRKPETGQIAGPLGAMGQRLWEPSGPNGFADTVGAWASAEGMKTRLDVAAAIARQVAPGAVDPRNVAETILGPLASTPTRQAIARAESKPQALALLLMSPEFQRR